MKIVLIVLTISIILLLLLSIMLLKQKIIKPQTTIKPYTIKPDTNYIINDGFDGVNISKLAQPADFYSKNREATLIYLNAVYPTAKESLNKLDDLNLASFYNSLWFYFNCKGEYKDNDLGSFTQKLDDTTWDGLPCKDKYPLPYTPQGWLYNFYTYQKYNVPEIYSDSDNSKNYLKLENASSTRPGVMGTYVNRYIRSSGIMWVMQRTIQRDIWYPNGLYNDKGLNNNDPDNWKINVGKIPLFNYPTGWYGKLGDNQYIEITHSPSYSGDAINMSPFWWYNASVGSGLFLFLGKTLAVKNKISGIFVQSQMLSKTSEGQKLLQKWYNTIDPYEIVWGIIGLCGYNMNTKQQYCDFSVQACSIACEPDPIGYGKAAGIKLSNFYTETLKFQKEVLNIQDEYPTKEGIKQAIDLAVDNKNYNLAHIAEQLLPDETNFFMGINLDLETLQFYEDPNGNDNYVFEIIDLRIPDKYKDAAKNRDYSGFMHIANKDVKPVTNANTWSAPTDATQNYYLETAISEYLHNMYTNKWLSIRDPLDIYNEEKVLSCEGIKLSKDCNNKYPYSMYCSQIPLLNEYKCLSPGNEFNNNTCILRGDNPTC